MPRKRRDPDPQDPSPVPPEDASHDAGDLESVTPLPDPDPPTTSLLEDSLPVHETNQQGPPPPIPSPQQGFPMPDVKTVEAPQFNPVASVVRTVKAPPQVQIRMVNDRASHFYFKRILGQLKALGKYR